MKRHGLLLLLALIPSGPGAAFAGPNGSIDMFLFDPVTGSPDLNSCQGTTVLIPGESRQILISVQARLAGLTAAGIAGAELYVDGLENLPPNWTCADTAMSVVHVGDICEPVLLGGGTTRRGNVAFQSCQPGTNGFVELYRMQISASPLVQDLPSDMFIRVIAGNPPGNLNFRCPLFNLCDNPSFTKVCVTGGEFIINPEARSCTVAVERRTWSGLKQLFR